MTDYTCMKSHYSKIVNAMIPYIERIQTTLGLESWNYFIPFTNAKTVLSFEDIYNDTEGFLHSLHICTIPYIIYKNITVSIPNGNNLVYMEESDAINAINNVLLQPVVRAAQSAFNAIADNTFSLYYKIGTTFESSFDLYLVYHESGEKLYDSIAFEYVTIHHDAPTYERVFLRINFPEGIKKEEQVIAILKKAGIEQTVKKAAYELKAKGYIPLSTSEYKEKVKNGALLDRNFTDMIGYLSIGGTFASVKEHARYIRTDFDDISCIIQTIIKTSAKSEAMNKFNSKSESMNTFNSKNQGFFNPIINRGIDKGYIFEKVWITLYNEKTNKITHQVIADSSKISGITIPNMPYSDKNSDWNAWESYKIKDSLYFNYLAFEDMKKFISITDGDLGHSCDPAQIHLNKHTYRLTINNGQMVFAFQEKIDRDWYNLLHPLSTQSVGNSIKALFQTFQKKSNDWDLLSQDDYNNPEIRASLYSKVLEKFYCNPNNPYRLIYENRYHDDNGKTHDLHITYKTAWYLYKSLIIVELASIRSKESSPKDFCPTNIRNIYIVFYNLVSKQFATPLLASDGDLSHLYADKPVKKTINHIHTFIPNKNSKKFSFIKQEFNPTADIVDFIQGKFSVACAGIYAKSLKDGTSLYQVYTTEKMNEIMYSVNRAQNKLKSVLSHERITATYPRIPKNPVIKNSRRPYVLAHLLPTYEESHILTVACDTIAYEESCIISSIGIHKTPNGVDIMAYTIV